jgi:hypothetical protein
MGNASGNGHTKVLDGYGRYHLNSTCVLLRENIVHPAIGGILTCNLASALLNPKASGHTWTTVDVLLTVARQPVICTRFPFNPDFYRKPIPVIFKRTMSRYPTQKIKYLHKGIFCKLFFY